MDGQRALAVYAAEMARDREAYLYQHALNKARVIIRSMTPEEKKAYLASEAFANVLRQIQRRDRIYQGLLRGELVQTAQAAEFDRLAPLIEKELAAGRPVSLPFLRTVERSKVSLEKAQSVLALFENNAPRKALAERRAEHLANAEKRVVKFLSKGEITRLYRPDERVETVLPHMMRTVFTSGLTMNAVNLAMAPAGLTGYLREEIRRLYPDIGACVRIAGPDGTAIGELLRNELHREKDVLFQKLKHQFPQDRIRSLLSENPHLKKIQKKADAVFEKERKIRSALLDAIPENFRDLYPLARAMQRRVILHIGPTNSGKTHESVERLKGARQGIYLGPLRLLAAEQFEVLNMADIPCSLVTGEEQIRVPDSRVQSSTVEMADLGKRYDVAVIDECQMIGDRDRGGAWTAAILGLQAEEMHLCASPDAEGLLTRIILDCGDTISITRHERMTPLELEKSGFQFPSGVRAGDALIVFSKARVHAVAAELRSRGYRVSLIYGALPPDVRRNQAERFRRGETEVVVSTDAIAMGMNLPIERIVFLESEKYDGDITRMLTDAEIKQIAGRAGRYGQYDIGYVNAYGFKSVVGQALARPLLPLTQAVIRFPESLLGIPLPLTQIINQWLNMKDREYFSKASAVRMAFLAGMMETRHTDKMLLYRFLCIPFDETEPDLLNRWKLLYQAESAGEHIDAMAEMPEIRDPEECTIQVLDTLEADYRRCDLYYNYVRLFIENPDPILDEIQRRKELISQGIVHILSTQKLQQRTCRSCGKNLPWNWPFRLCDSCYHGQAGYRGKRGRR